MVNTLNLQADAPGVYEGLSANYSGDGFAGMRFVAEATTTEAFHAWVLSVREKPLLDAEAYLHLRAPSKGQKPVYYGGVSTGLFEDVVDSFSAPRAGHN